MAAMPPRVRLLCHCLGVTPEEVEAAVRRHRLRTVSQVTRRCRAGGGCRSCWPDIEAILQRVRAERPPLLRRWLAALGIGRTAP
jgi:NAD(P)H-nitrite reductase large subunit